MSRARKASGTSAAAFMAGYSNPIDSLPRVTSAPLVDIDGNCQHGRRSYSCETCGEANEQRMRSRGLLSDDAAGIEDAEDRS